MKNEELFEALSELDDELIANAKHIDTYGGQTVVLRRTPVWKIVTGFVAAAACTALLVVGGVHAVNYVNGKAPVSPASDPSSTVVVSKDTPHVPAGYPEEAKYVYEGDYGELVPSGILEVDTVVYSSYYELAEKSDLIVSGEFTDIAHQTVPTDSDLTDGDFRSYNTFYIDKVLRGDKKTGDKIAISQQSVVVGGMIHSDPMSPMICGDRWVYFLNERDGYYYPVSCVQGRYPLSDSKNKELKDCGKYGYYGNPIPGEDKVYEELTETLETFEHTVSQNFDGVILTVKMKKDSFAPDDDIWVKATVRNTTDKPIGLWVPVLGDGSHKEILTEISRGEYRLTDIDTCDKGFDTAISSHIIEPGKEYVQEMTFGEPVWSSKRPESGEYKGTATITLLSDPNDTSSATTAHTVEFSLTIEEESDDKDPDEPSVPDNATNVTKVYEYGKSDTEDWEMSEFPGVTFRCDGNYVAVLADGEYGYSLYVGMPVEDVYLADLNGDGYREIVSTAAFASGVIYEHVYAFDFANGIRYELRDRMMSEYYVLIDDNGVLKVRRLEYKASNLGSEQPLTLDMMTNSGSVHVFKGTEPAEWTMDELPGITFRADRSGVYARGEDGSERNIADVYEYKLINCVWLYDNDNDGKREIMLEYTDMKGMHVSSMKSPDVLLKEFSQPMIPEIISGSEYVLRDHAEYIIEDLSFLSAYDYCNVDENAAVVSFGEGEVVAADAEPNYNGGRGRYVVVRDELGYYYCYSHLGGVSVNIGDKVTAGTQIGIIGNSGGRWRIDGTGFGVCLATYDHMPDISGTDEVLPE
ncbi:MAG: peptidoglycan DD-metalloendopeptidase family protein [Oscillospiraceae bacterium]